ncbi:MAG: hypothetical protein ACRCWI_00690 [Brevinema sp.]
MNRYYKRLLENQQERQGGALCSYGYVVLSYFGVFFLALMGVTLSVAFDLTLDTEKMGVLWILCYIPYYIFSYMRIKRLNQFIIRKKDWYQNLSQLIALKNPLLITKIEALTPISIPAFFTLMTIAIISALFSELFQNYLLEFYVLEYLVWIILLFIAHLVIYQLNLNNYWDKIQKIEYIITAEINKQAWVEEDLVFTVDPKKERNFLLWYFYSAISIGIMQIIWDYRIHTDPDNMYARFYQNEEEVLELISTHGD